MNNKRTVYTLTFHDVPNIGAALQAYALQKYIKSLNYDTKVINYKPPYHYFEVYKPVKGLKRYISKLEMHRNIRAFSKKDISLTKSTLSGYRLLNKFNAQDIVVVGSDQIWNPSLTGKGVDRTFFVDSASNVKRISYAASAGGISLRKNSEGVRKLLEKFSAIGVREDSLRLDLSACGIRSDAVTVLDPTFLLDSYSDLIDREQEIVGDHIFSYEVSSSETRKLFTSEVINFSQLCGLDVRHLGSNPIKSLSKYFYTPTPTKWLRELNDAKYVLTNSFHGLAFSIILKKNFLYVLHKEEHKNARARSLLDLAGMSDRAVSKVSKDSMNLINSSIDYSKIKIAIQNSREFLIDSLK